MVKVHKSMIVRPHKRIFYALAALLVVPLLALASYDLFVFQPYRPDIDKLIARASSSEKSPSESLRRVLHISATRMALVCTLPSNSFSN